MVKAVNMIIVPTIVGILKSSQLTQICGW